MLQSIAQSAASGVVIGCVYALIALSIVVVYKSTEVVNFAGGEMVMLGGYLAMIPLLYFGFPYAAAFPAVVAVTFLIGAGFERVVLKSVLRRAPPGQSVMVSMVIATFGLSYVLKGGVRVVPYTEEVRTLPALIDGPPVFLGPVVLQRQDLAIVAVTLLIVTALWWFFSFTMLGKALRASSQNARAASLVGIPVGRMHMTVWGIAAALAAVAGILLAPKLLMTPDVGVIVILAMAAAVIGGFTNLPGAVVGGIVLGVLQNLAGLFIGSRALALAPFVVIMVVLVLRPQGLFGGGGAQAKKV
jgi:branched-chain amino acid transport system permease protein